MTAICPGSFDPITNGHIDIIQRTLCFADRVIVAIVGQNIFKKSFFTLEERLTLTQNALSGLKDGHRAQVKIFTGLLSDFFNECNADIIVRGLRIPIEYEHDLAQTLANKWMNPRLETLFLPANPAHVFLSSSIVKEISAFGGDIKEMVPTNVAAAIQQKLQSHREA